MMSPGGDCSDGKHGPIDDWDVSHVTDMGFIFSRAASFNADISKWDVSSVTYMSGMFWHATSFNIDISKWDVSRVTDMSFMFYGATCFHQSLSGDAWLNSMANQKNMFEDSHGSIGTTSSVAAPPETCSTNSNSHYQEGH